MAMSNENFKLINKTNPSLSDNCPIVDIPWWLSMSISFSIYLINTLYIFFKWLHNWRMERITKIQNEILCREKIQRIYKGALITSRIQITESSSNDDDSDFGTKSELAEIFKSSKNNKVHSDRMKSKRFSLPHDQLVAGYGSMFESFLSHPHRRQSIDLRRKNSRGSIAGLRERKDSFSYAPGIDQIIPDRRTTLFGFPPMHEEIEEEQKKCNHFFNFLAAHHVAFCSPKYQLKIKLFCEQWTSFSYPKGRYMALIFMIFSTLSWLIYIVGTVDAPPEIRNGICLTSRMKVLSKLNMIINFFFLAYFILRSFVEVLAIPSAIINSCIDRRYIDLDFIRAINIFRYSDVFGYMGLLTSNNRLQAVQISFAMFAMWMFGSGMIHVVRNVKLTIIFFQINHLGDFWRDDAPPEDKADTSFFSCCYFLLVTMSTVGYGDISPESTLAKIFICVFVCVSMGVFASFWPELIRSFDNNAIPTGKYRTIFGQKHVLVCGYFNNESIRSFLKGFFRKEHANKRKTLNMVILRPINMDLSLKAILTKYNAWVHYFTGSPNNPQDLNRINLKDARAAIVLACPHSKFSDDEDGANIMQAITLKAQRERLRVLVQLHHSRNKLMLNNFPRWTCLSNDMVICMDELKLGLMAYNCIAPGFSTLILNLLNSYRNKNDYPKNTYRNWRTEYEYSLAMNLYDVGISHNFDMLDARELAVFMHESWGTVLVAIKINEPNKPPLMINPCLYKDFIINPSSMRAIVIARSSFSARLLEHYCKDCSAHLDGRICTCVHNRNIYRRRYWDSNIDKRSRPFPNIVFQRDRFDQGLGNSNSFESFRTSFLCNNNPELDPTNDSNQVEFQTVLHDRTGTFHWVHDVPFNKAVLTPPQASIYNFADHIVLCLVGPIAGGPINLANFIMPFRFHWLPVRSIIILGDANLISETEWLKLRNFPRVYIVDGSPCSFSDLHSVQILKCHACAIIGETGTSSKFDECDITLQDKNTLFCAMNIRSLFKREARSIHITTELRHENNAHHFTTQNFHEAELKLTLRFQEPFAHGIIFSNSLLYSSISSLYFNQNVFLFLKILISGQAVDEIENFFSFGTSLPKETDSKNLIPGVKVELRPLNTSPFCIIAEEERSLGVKPIYKVLFQRSLMYWRILCLGLYRLNENNMRYVFTNPPADTVLLDTDKDFTPPPRPKQLEIQVPSSDDDFY